MKSPYFQDFLSCKRVIGMPGDYVVRDPDASPTIGGAPLPGVKGHYTDLARKEPMMIQVPEGHVWVAGDNLSHSRDSRFHGAVPMALIQGKMIYNGTTWTNWTSFRKSQLQPALGTDEETTGATP
jgi:mitochondrial inner membrane protease subunit 1